MGALNHFRLNHNVDVTPAYVRSERNILSGGLTRRPEHGVDDWPSQEEMVRVNAADELWAHTSLPYDKVPLGAKVPGEFAILAEILHFLQILPRYRVCEWRPSNFALSGLLEYWGVPVIFDQLIERGVYDILVLHTLQPTTSSGDRDVFLSVGRCKSWGAIVDFRLTLSLRFPRYAAIVAPSGIRDNKESDIWTSPTLIDSALTGDPLASQRMVYCSGGIMSSHFDLHPNIDEVRALLQFYRLAGVVCGEYPVGAAQTHSATGTSGETTFITSEGGYF